MDIVNFLSQHPVLSAALAIVLMALLGNEILIGLRSGHKLGPSAAVRLMNDREPLVLDVRSQADYKKGHVIGAKSLPLARIAEAEREIAADKSRPMLVYCALGTACSSAREKLLKQGFGEVYTLQGGMNNWTGSGLPVSQPTKQSKSAKQGKQAQSKAHTKQAAGNDNKPGSNKAARKAAKKTAAAKRSDAA